MGGESGQGVRRRVAHLPPGARSTAAPGARTALGQRCWLRRTPRHQGGRGQARASSLPRHLPAAACDRRPPALPPAASCRSPPPAPLPWPQLALHAPPVLKPYWQGRPAPLASGLTPGDRPGRPEQTQVPPAGSADHNGSRAVVRRVWPRIAPKIRQAVLQYGPVSPHGPKQSTETSCMDGSEESATARDGSGKGESCPTCGGVWMVSHWK